MLHKKTVIVLGAGASAEFGLPVGAGLAQNISNALHFDDINNISFSGRGGRLLRAIHQTGGKQMLLAAQAISKGVILSSSIDSFLDNHKLDDDIVKVGKMAILDQISQAEYSSSLYYSNSNAHNRINFNKLLNSWLLKLYRLISAKVSADSVCSIFDNLTIINFNYDRCVEQFLIGALEVNYRIDNRMASKIVRSLKIIRPYGSIGDF